MYNLKDDNYHKVYNKKTQNTHNQINKTYKQ